MTNFELMRDRLLARAGLIEPPKAPFQGMTFEQLRQQECDDGFCEKMDNRLVMGAMRYGRSKRKDIKPFYAFKMAFERLQLYEDSGNLEYLVDAANMCRLEFKWSLHPLKHWEAKDRG